MYMSPGGCPRGVYGRLSLPLDGNTRIAPGFCYWDNRTRIDLARIAAPAWLHQDGNTRTGPTGMALLGQYHWDQLHWNSIGMALPGWWHLDSFTGMMAPVLATQG